MGREERVVDQEKEEGVENTLLETLLKLVNFKKDKMFHFDKELHFLAI